MVHLPFEYNVFFDTHLMDGPGYVHSSPFISCPTLLSLDHVQIEQEWYSGLLKENEKFLWTWKNKEGEGRGG